MPKTKSLFISHGSPDTAIADTQAHGFMKGLAGSTRRPDAIVVVSAHFEAAGVAISGDNKPETIHDFRGFSPELCRIDYGAPGCPELAAKIAQMLREAGLAAGVIYNREFDHGTWVPLYLMYPDADIPVVQISVDPVGGPAHHYFLGRVLEPLCSENVLIIGSGSMTHNLRAALAVMGDGARDTTRPEWLAVLWAGWRNTCHAMISMVCLLIASVRRMPSKIIRRMNI